MSVTYWSMSQCNPFFFSNTTTTEIYTLSLHDALPIYPRRPADAHARDRRQGNDRRDGSRGARPPLRDRKSTRLNSSHANISYAVFCLKKKSIFPRKLYYIPGSAGVNSHTKNLKTDPSL